jgi:hypothetical protein
MLVDQTLNIGSKRSFYRVMHHHEQQHRRGRAQLPQEPGFYPGCALMSQTRADLGQSEVTG